MATAGTLAVNVVARTASFHRGMRGATGSVTKFTSDTTRQLGRLQNSFRGLYAVIAGGAVVAGAKKALGLAQAQIDAERKLGAVLKATGGAAGLSAKEIKGYAAELQGLTNFGDEATIGAAAILGTFTKIRGPVFKQALSTVQDMATIFETDLKSSAIQLGKALNDPIKGITALSRVGVSFTEQQKEQIKVFMEAGEVAKAQGVILRELENEFGGIAEATVDSKQQMANALSDLGETIGDNLMPYVNQVAKSMNDWLTGSKKKADELSGSLKELTLLQKIEKTELRFYSTIEQRMLEARLGMAKLFGADERTIMTMEAQLRSHQGFRKELKNLKGIHKDERDIPAKPIVDAAGDGASATDFLTKALEGAEKQFDSLTKDVTFDKLTRGLGDVEKEVYKLTHAWDEANRKFVETDMVAQTEDIRRILQERQAIIEREASHKDALAKVDELARQAESRLDRFDRQAVGALGHRSTAAFSAIHGANREQANRERREKEMLKIQKAQERLLARINEKIKAGDTITIEELEL